MVLEDNKEILMKLDVSGVQGIQVESKGDQKVQ